MPTTIESLELEVKQNGNSAVQGIAALSASLARLKSATKGGMGLTSVATQIRNLNTALSSTDTSKVDKLASSLEKLKSLGSLKISSSIASQLKNIGSAASSLTGVDFSGISQMSNAVSSLGGITKSAGLQSAITQLGKIPELAKTLNGVNWAQFTSQMQSLTNSLAPLASQLNTVSAAFARLPSNVRQLVQNTNNLATANNNASKSYINLYAKLRMAITAVKSAARTIASWITQSNKYIEDLNLFTVALGEYADSAKEYAERVSELLGIDPADWLRNQGVFNTIIKGFGVASDKAIIMSKNLTQLGYDISSFYNISTEDAFTKLQSGISGELEPLRRLGYDLSVARLQQEAYTLGIEKSVSAMTQAEKSQLRYYAIMTQVTDAQGDMARTLNAPANQLRILQAQVTQCARALGNIFIPALNAVLPYAIAVAKVIRLIANAIASLFGFSLPEIDYSGISAGASAVADSAESAEDGFGGAAKAAKKLKDNMLGIDELNVIPQNDDSSGSGGTGSDAGGGGFDIDLPQYDFLGGLVESKVGSIVDKMKEWLGLTGEIDSWSDLLNTRLGTILTTVGAIGLGMAAWKVSKGVLDGLAYMTNLKELGLDKPLTISIGAALAVTGITLEWSGIAEAIKNELNSDNFIQIVSGGGLTVAGGALIGKALGSAILGGGIAGIIAGLPAFGVGIYDAITNGLNWLNGALVGAGATAAGAGIGAIIGACGGPIGAGIGALIGLAVGLVTDGIIAITEHWEEIKDVLSNFFTVTIPNVWNNFVSWLKNLPETIRNWWSNLLQPIKDFDWSQLGHDIGYKVGTAVKNICNAFKQFFTETLPEVWEKVKSSFETFFTETLPNFFTQTIPKLWEKIKTFFTETIPNALKDIKQWFKDVGQAIWDGIVEGWNTAIKAITDFVKGFVDGFKEALGIHSPSKVFAEIGTFLVDGLWQGIKDTWHNITDFFSQKLEDIKKVCASTWNSIKTTASTVWGNIKTFFSNTWNNIKSTASTVWNGLKTTISTTWDNIKTNTSNTWNTVKTSLSNTWSGVKTTAGTTWSNLKSTIGTAWSNISTDTSEKWADIKTSLSNAWDNIGRKVDNARINLTSNIRQSWADIKTDTAKKWADIKTSLSNAWDNIGRKVDNARINLTSNIRQSWADIKTDTAKKWADIKTSLSNAWDNIGRKVDNARINLTSNIRQSWADIKTDTAKKWADIKTSLSNAWDNIKLIFDKISGWVYDNVIEPVSGFFTDLWSGFSDGADTAWTNIVQTLNEISDWVYDNVVQPVSKFFSGLWDDFSTKASDAWEGVKEVFGKVGSFFETTFENAWEGVVKVFSSGGEIFTDIKDGIVNSFKSIVNGLIKGLNNVVSIPFKGINTAINKIKSIEIAGLSPFSGLQTISVPEIPQLAEGGFPKSGQLFIAREAGAEMVGNIGGRTAVANNDQIVNGIYEGVKAAMRDAINNSDNSNQFVVKVYLDGREITSAVSSQQRANGYVFAK